MIFGIPSYKRPQCRTARMLLENGIDKHDIVISVQTQEDRDAYKRLHDVEIIYGEADCAAGNRNTLLRNTSGEIILLDDDITSFSYYDNGKYIADTRKALQGFIVSAKGIKGDVSIIGAHPTNNDLNRRNRPEITYLALLQGTVLMFRNRDVLFDERCNKVEVRLVGHAYNKRSQT